ncbi:MAG: DUF3089 domain-containing protein [Lactobacillaceae bacterium]|nr:DUF3089 domain-containing protein [Lactobacillaceae bacterium]
MNFFTNKRISLRVGLVAILATLLLVGGGATMVDASTSQNTTPTNYATASNWAAKPTTNTKDVDVFYLYPTSFTGNKTTNYIGTAATTKVYGAGYATKHGDVFKETANIYAPAYRQYDAYYLMDYDLNTQLQKFYSEPLEDATAAFEYYLEHYNNGRPFILAGHSQGSLVVKGLLQTYFTEHPALFDQMVATYMIGGSITQDELDANSHLKFATGATDAGVIVSYNTEAPSLTVTNPVVVPNAVAINPISWTRGEELAPKSDNLGSRINGTKTMNLADAKLNLARGVVECSTVPIGTYSYTGQLATIFPQGIYHNYDYDFYHYNLVKNVADRTETYFNNLEE